MDFSSALQDLERTADAAARGGGSGGGDRRRGRPDHYNDRGGAGPPSQRPRHSYDGGRPPYGRDRRGGGNFPPSRGRGGRGREGRGGRGRYPYDPLEDLRRMGYRFNSVSGTSGPPRPPPPPPSQLGTPQRPYHIALLAICIDGLPYEALWRQWAAAAQSNNTIVSLLVHAKYPDRIQSEFLRQRMLVHPPTLGRGNSYADPVFLSHQPKWGSVQITLAMIDLLRDALLIGTTNTTGPASTEEAAETPVDPRFSPQRYVLLDSSSSLSDSSTSIPTVDKFIFISESCIPVATLPEFTRALLGTPEDYDPPTATEPEKETGAQNIASDKAKRGSEEDNTEETKAVSSATDTTGSALSSKGGRGSLAPWHVSWVHARNRNSPDTPKNMYERAQFADIHRSVPGQFRWKADQWMALSRPHAAAVAAVDGHLRPGDQLWKTAFTRISASDEMYFPTVLALLQILRDPKEVQRRRQQQQQHQQQQRDEKLPSTTMNDSPSSETVQTDGTTKDKTAASTTATTSATEEAVTVTAQSLSPEIRFQSVTYTDWSEGMRNPRSFSRGSTDFTNICRLARQQGSLLARKFILTAPSAPSDTTDTKPVEDREGYLSYEAWSKIMENAVPLTGGRVMKSRWICNVLASWKEAYILVTSLLKVI